MKRHIWLPLAAGLILLVAAACSRPAPAVTPLARPATVQPTLPPFPTATQTPEPPTARPPTLKPEATETATAPIAATHTPVPRRTQPAGRPTEARPPAPSPMPSPTPSIAAQALAGHSMAGDRVIFVFDESLHSLQGEVSSVAVAGDFNHFNPEADGWQLADDDKDGLWTLEAPADVVQYGHRFAFVANQDGRLLAPPPGGDKRYLLENGEGGHFLVVGGEPDNPLLSRLEARSYVGAQGDSIPYRLLVPEDYDPSQAYPLVVFLHGAGERGYHNDLPIRIRNGAYEFIQTAEGYAYFMLVPQCPTNAWWSDDQIVRLVLGLLDEIRLEFSIDPSRIYVTGLSMGGTGMWELVSREPGVFAGGIAICGWANDTGIASRIAHIPFLVFHGSQDPIVPVAGSRRMVEALQAAGGTVKYTEFPGADHMIWDKVYTDRQVIDWLFSQSRQGE